MLYMYAFVAWGHTVQVTMFNTVLAHCTSIIYYYVRCLTHWEAGNTHVGLGIRNYTCTSTRLEIMICSMKKELWFIHV